MAAVAITISIAIVLVMGSQPIEEQKMSMESESEKLKVFTTFFAIDQFTKNVAGDRAIVKNLVPYNTHPHNYEIPGKTLVELSSADMVVYNGASFESFVPTIMESGSFDHIMFVDSTSAVKLRIAEHDDHDDHGDEAKGVFDPHVWLDPILAKEQVQMIATSMSLVDPENEQYYMANAKSYSMELDSLDSKIRDELSDCKTDTFVPFHNAFSYYAERYDLHANPIGGNTPQDQITAKDIESFVNFVKANDIKYLLAEELVDSRLSDQLANEAGVSILLFSPVEGLTDEEIENGTTYIDKMEYNLDNLKIALECS